MVFGALLQTKSYFFKVCRILSNVIFVRGIGRFKSEGFIVQHGPGRRRLGILCSFRLNSVEIRGKKKFRGEDQRRERALEEGERLRTTIRLILIMLQTQKLLLLEIIKL